MIKNVVLLVLIAVLLFNCNKENRESEIPGQELIFESLVINRDTITPGETAQVRATASGVDLSYHWSTSLGDIIGSGNEVIYAASPCHIGRNEIKCNVKDGYNQSKTKTIYIVVE